MHSLAVVTLVLLAATQAAPSPLVPRGPHRRETRSFELALSGPADTAFPLFGPVREREWAPDWAPRFLAPDPPAQDSSGAVFTTERHGGTSVWVMTTYDPHRRRVRYVVLHPELVTCEIAIDVAATGTSTSRAHVTYRYTALSEHGERFIAHWLDQFPHLARDWESAINPRLAALARTP